ncbi:nucleoside deaminase [Pseudoclavibacter albus]
MHTTEAMRAHMREALSEGIRAASWGDVPIGAVVVDEHGTIIGRGRNERELRKDPSAHAEVVALREAAAHRGSWRLEGCTLVVTLEPCAMCAGTLLAARVDAVVFGAWDDKAGAVGSVYDLVRDGYLPQRAGVVGGVLAEECAEPIRAFFRDNDAANS